MATWMVHLRIADGLLPYLKVDETAFVMGNIAPDSGVPNADWSEYHPPKAESHFQKKTADGSFFDPDAFRRRYLSGERIRRYSLKEYSFFLGYYVHLLTDVRWGKTVVALLKKEYPDEYAKDKNGLIRAAKADWYDLDFLYLEQHPGFRAFAVYENAEGFSNDYLDLFSRDAFENRRQYICGFYHGREHGDLHREYRYLTQEQADSFVKDTVQMILGQIGGG